MSRLLPALLLAWASSSAAFGTLGDYCAHPPRAQRESLSGRPLPSDTLGGNSDLQLAGVHVIFRHGARTLLSDLRCWEPWSPGGPPCGPHLGVSAGWHGKSGVPPLMREYLDVFPDISRGPSAITEGRHSCAVGQLMPEAVEQFKALAEAIRDAYAERLEITPQDTRLYATETDRATESIWLLQHFLFNTSRSTTSPKKLKTRSLNMDPWNNGACPNAHAAFSAADHIRISAEGPLKDFAERWFAATGTKFSPSFKDCLIQADCAGERVMPVPPALKANRSLFEEALSISGQMYASVWQSNVKKNQMMSAPVLLELMRIAEDQLRPDGQTERLALYGAHDTFISTFLVSLGVWDGSWPPYSHALVLEIYRDVGSNPPRPLFRLLRNGKPLLPLGCGSGLPGGMCDLRHLISAEVRKVVQEPTTWVDFCYGEPHKTMTRELEASARADVFFLPSWLSSATGIGIVMLSFVMGLLLGRCMPVWHGLQRPLRVADDCARKALLG